MTEQINELLKLIIPILAMIESNGDPNAINKKEDAVGILQIRPIMVDEVNRIWNMKINSTSWTLEDRKDPKVSTDMCRIYLNYWIPRKSISTTETSPFGYLSAPTSQRQEAIVETAARLWNGGSSKGFDSKQAKAYGLKAVAYFQVLKAAKKLASVSEKLGMGSEAFCFSHQHELQNANHD